MLYRGNKYNSIMDNKEYQSMILKNYEFKDYIIDFTDVLESNIDRKDLSNFYHNVLSLNIVKKYNSLSGFFLSRLNLGAIYRFYKNEIHLVKKDFSYLYHELLHMASCYHGDIIYLGLRKNEFENIGDGINEGYTQLLAERYFPNVTKTYLIETKLARALEVIIGDKMTSLYFNADYKGLIKELSKYASIEKIKEFISNFDFIYANIPSGKKDIIYSELMAVNWFLIETYYNKLDGMNKEEIISILTDYCCDLPYIDMDMFAINMEKIKELVEFKCKIRR